MAVGAVGIWPYGWLVFFSPPRTFIPQLTAFAAVLGILAWVGYALATTPPKPIEEYRQRSPESFGRNRKDHATLPLVASAANCNQNQILKALVVP
jgi:predicted DNA-binding transcriptional regulator